MSVRWKVVAEPAAAKWVRDRVGAEIYIRTRAADIYWRFSDEPCALSELPPAEFDKALDVCLRRYDRDGWLPCTLQDVEAAERQAEAMADPDETPAIGILVGDTITRFK
jgi:hypothetical protein